MPAVPSRRACVALLATLATIVLSGCTMVVAGRPISLQPPTEDVDAGEVVVEGATDEEIDVLARNALADLETFWTDQMPDVFGQPFEPLEGGYFSVDPGDPGAFPGGIGCGTNVAEVEGNAFYCSAPDAPNSDSISYDRTFLTELAEGYGRFIPALVMAHEFGHAVQARVGYPDFSISVETQADCFAGAWTSWVADGEAEFSSIRAPELDELLRGYVLLRDPPGTSATVDAAHGSFFDRVSAFQEGFESGPTACRDNFTAQRPYTQGRFLDPQDQATQGNASFDEAQRIAGTALPEFWTRAFSEVFGETFDPPALEPFAGDPPACAPDDERDLVYCPDDNLVAYDQRDLAGPVYEQFFDYAVVTALSLPYAQAARDQLGLPADDADAVRSAVCLTGWFSAEFRDGELGATISPGDLDESVQFLLEYGRDPAVLPETRLSGFQLVDLFRNGFFQGPSACDVGL